MVVMEKNGGENISNPEGVLPFHTWFDDCDMRMSGSGFEFNVDPTREQRVSIAHELHCSDSSVATF